MTDYTEADVPSQAGRTVLITGANTGIGYDTARVFAQRGARVLLGCRSEARAAEAIDRIKALQSDAKVQWLPLDLASLASVQAAAKTVNRQEDLDVLVNNAGVMAPPRQTTADGFELQFGVNHLGHFALTGRLLPKLINRPGARIVTVSSLAHRNGKIDFDDIHAERAYRRMARYGMSKMANVLFTYELQRRLEAADAQAIAVACHPGGSVTELGRNVPLWLSWLLKPLSLVMNSSAEGALPTLLAATGENVSGADYFGPMRLGEMRHSAHRVDTAPAAKDAADAARLWALSEELTGVRFTG
ncbi:MAG: oxidoreductase [Pseudomonadales bacterium]